MPERKFSKFIRSSVPASGPVTDRDLDVLTWVLRCRFLSAAQIARLVGGNEDVTHRRLRRLWERGLISRWAFPGFRTHSEFYYYLDNEPSGLRLAHFCYEADRGTMGLADMLRKFRAYYQFIKRQQKHKQALGVHPRAVLVETTDEDRGKQLMEIARHPLVCGESKRSGLFWFTISP